MDKSATPGAGGGAGRLTVQEGDQLLAGALGAQRKGNGREAVDGIESEQDVVVLNTGLIRGAEGGARGGGLVTAIPSIRRSARRWGRAHRWCWSRQPWRATVEREKGAAVAGNRIGGSVFWFGGGQGWIFGQALGRAAGIACGAGCDAMRKVGVGRPGVLETWTWTNALAARVGWRLTVMLSSCRCRGRLWRRGCRLLRQSCSESTSGWHFVANGEQKSRRPACWRRFAEGLIADGRCPGDGNAGGTSRQAPVHSIPGPGTRPNKIQACPFGSLGASLVVSAPCTSQPAPRAAGRWMVGRWGKAARFSGAALALQPNSDESKQHCLESFHCWTNTPSILA